MIGSNGPYFYVRIICNTIVDASPGRFQSAFGLGFEASRGPNRLMWLDDRFEVKNSSPRTGSDTLLAAYYRFDVRRYRTSDNYGVQGT